MDTLAFVLKNSWHSVSHICIFPPGSNPSFKFSSKQTKPNKNRTNKKPPQLASLGRCSQAAPKLVYDIGPCLGQSDMLVQDFDSEISHSGRKDSEEFILQPVIVSGTKNLSGFSRSTAGGNDRICFLLCEII